MTSLLLAAALGLGLGIVTGMPLGVVNVAIVDAAVAGRTRFATGIGVGGALGLGGADAVKPEARGDDGLTEVRSAGARECEPRVLAGPVEDDDALGEDDAEAASLSSSRSLSDLCAFAAFSAFSGFSVFSTFSSFSVFSALSADADGGVGVTLDGEGAGCPTLPPGSGGGCETRADG